MHGSHLRPYPVILPTLQIRYVEESTEEGSTAG
jgi:hypothetical protein